MGVQRGHRSLSFLECCYLAFQCLDVADEALDKLLQASNGAMQGSNGGSIIFLLHLVTVVRLEGLFTSITAAIAVESPQQAG